MTLNRTRRYLGTQRVARVCQVSPATVAHWIDQGHLPGHKTPTGRRRVATPDLVAFLRAHGMSVPEELDLAAQAAAPARAVVVVEDDNSYRRTLVRFFARSELGVQVVEAATGVDGLLQIGRVQPAVVVLDYNLPDLDAVQVIERLLAPGTGLGLEIVVISAAAPEGAIERLRSLGVSTVLHKAEGMDAVVGAVRHLLERRAVA